MPACPLRRAGGDVLGGGPRGGGRGRPGSGRIAPPQPPPPSPGPRAPSRPELAGRPGRGSGGESVRRRGPARAAHRPGAGAALGTGKGAGSPSAASHQPSRRGAPGPARPCPAPPPARPPGPAFLAGACGFLPAPGARSWLAAGRGARGERAPGRGPPAGGGLQPLPRGSAPTRAGGRRAGRLGRTRAPRSLRPVARPGPPRPQAPQPARHGVRRGQSDAADTQVASHAPQARPFPTCAASSGDPHLRRASRQDLGWPTRWPPAASDGGRGCGGGGWSPRQEPGAGSLSSDSPKVTQAIRGDVLTGAWGLL